MKYSVREVLDFVGAFFMGDSPVHRALVSIGQRLDESDVPFVLVGGMAVNAHGHRRTTEDV
jgi:hypothetical protein